MTTIGHLLDASCSWEQRLGVSQLLDRLPRDRFQNHVASVQRIQPTLRRALSCIDPLPHFGPIGILAGPGVARYVSRRGIDVLHAWGVVAAQAARAVSGVPLVVHLFDPCIASRQVKLLRTLWTAGPMAVVCSCEIVRRRLIEGGFPVEGCVVVRPGVDFAAINHWRRRSLRDRLGLTNDDFVVTVPHPVARGAGQFDACWAVTLDRILGGGVRVLLPGVGSEQRRIASFADAHQGESPIVQLGDDEPFERVVSACDAILVTPPGDISTTSIAWAMASETLVIGSAVHAVAELIANKVNGLLYKPAARGTSAAAIRRLLRDRASHAKIKEVARGQAYEVFGLRRYVEQVMQLYDNLLTGSPAGDGISDAAVAS